MDGILSEIKVLELAHAPSGAFCAKLLADQGADAIKVEPPGKGDPARDEPPFIGGEPHPDTSTVFLALNTNKLGITLDVEQAAGRDLFLQLASVADVIIESYPPGHMLRLGLGYEVLKSKNPKTAQSKRLGTELLIASKGLRIPDDIRASQSHRPQYRTAA